ncbi:hypothetical protein N7513_000917 [Penicillium frequentans]|nr:hypothetical protein N7513_000917 [Penicillium glabrum]
MTDDEAFSKTSLATCDDITFSPNTKKLLESCKTNLGGFLQAIREAKVSLPTGQGWEAAIATKKENVDIRDLMKIYHRFECHNIYRHVVEAELHTGTHWIRDMRTALANKLCQDFPERFQDQKAANKCLNWVDQGCRYQEWAEMFNEKTDLGYLIALPSDVSHSAFVSLLPLPENVVSRKLHRYTSRCTKEQMNAAVLKFKYLGIDRIVKDMGLTQLGNHIAATLREMTGRKRKDVGEFFLHASFLTNRNAYIPGPGEMVQSTWKSPRLTAGILSARVSQYGQNPTPPRVPGSRYRRQIHTCILGLINTCTTDHIFGHAESSMPDSAQDQPGIHGQQGSNTSNAMDDCAVVFEPFNGMALPPSPPGQNSGH